MFTKRLSIVLLLLTSCVNLMAQEVEFSVTAPNVVAVGEQFRVVYKLNARPQELNPPSFENFYILAGPSTSSSSSIQIVNGQMTQTYEFSYTYILEATQEGKYTIDPAKATVSKKEYTTNPLKIEVVKGTASQPSAARQQQPSDSQSQTTNDQPSEDVFVTVNIDKKSAYRGQPILATVAIYTRQNIAGFEEPKFPAFNGFWSQDVETPNNIQFERVNVDGKIYNVGVLKKYLLFPLKVGEINIEPFEIIAIVQQRGAAPKSMFDEFFGSYQSVRKRLASKPITLKIRDLPPNAPASFTGAVGKYSFDVELDKNKSKTNEAVNLKVKIAGSGNLKLIETPKISFPSSFEVFDPKTIDNIKTTQQGASGSRVFEYVGIPRGPGEFDLGNIEFTYFDPQLGKYTTLKSKSHSLVVVADGSEANVPQMVGFGREDIRFIGKDIRFIKGEGFKLRKNGAPLYGSAKYFGLLTILLVVSMLISWLLFQHRKLKGNVALSRTRKANKVAKKRLKLAKQFLTHAHAERFHEELLRAMWGYISDKLSIPVANLSSDSASINLTQRNVQDDDIEEFLRIISTCEYARYAPKGQQSQMAGLYQNAIDLISKLESIIK